MPRVTGPQAYFCVGARRAVRIIDHSTDVALWLLNQMHHHGYVNFFSIPADPALYGFSPSVSLDNNPELANRDTREGKTAVFSGCGFPDIGNGVSIGVFSASRINLL